MKILLCRSKLDSATHPIVEALLPVTDAFPDEAVFRDSLASITRKRELARRMGEPTDERLLNALQFAVLVNYDLRVLQVDVRSAGETWRGNLYTRYLVLLMHEAADDFAAILGTHLRGVLREWRAPDDMITDLNTLHGELGRFQHDNERVFAATRNRVTAHRDHDATVQLQALKALEIKALVVESYRLLDWMTACHRYCSRMLDWKVEQSRARRPI